MPLEDLLNRLCDMALEQRAELVAKRSKSESPAAPRVAKSGEEQESEASIRRRVRIHYGHKCSNCGSTHAVQEDHIIPVAAGGKTTFENMRLLCKNCNLRAAIDYFGQKKMDSYLEAPVRQYICGPARRRASGQYARLRGAPAANLILAHSRPAPYDHLICQS